MNRRALDSHRLAWKPPALPLTSWVTLSSATSSDSPLKEEASCEDYVIKSMSRAGLVNEYKFPFPPIQSGADVGLVPTNTPGMGFRWGSLVCLSWTFVEF